MNGDQHNRIVSFIWGIADDILRDLYNRGKYRDIILPMTVIRRLDAVLEPTKLAVLDMRKQLDASSIVNQDAPLRQAAGQAFYNTSKFTLRDLASRGRQQQLRADFNAYLDGFSPNVQEIVSNFELRNQVEKLSRADALGPLLGKFLSRDINLSPEPVKNADGSERLPGLDNHGMGTIFEELVRRFNEDNNEAAGEHWTPRDAVKVMARLIFEPIADQIESGTYLLYDGACGTGGMLTVAEETLQQLAADKGRQVATHLYGQEINSETYAICKADLLLKGEGEAADNIVGGAEHSTLSNDGFPAREFDFMLSNPPYGKTWSTDLERMGGKKGIQDPRFVIAHAGDPDYSLVTRANDGQMLFLANLISKMKHGTALGSRIAEVHNGSSLFNGDAGQGESNIRRWIIENDWLEAIVALPLNMFYNTDIATYIWVISNRKATHRAGRVQLINAIHSFQELSKNLGKKSCVLADADITRICETFARFEESEESRIFPNEEFGYWKVVVDRPLRMVGIDPQRVYAGKDLKALKEYGNRDEAAPPVPRRISTTGRRSPDPIHGRFATTVAGASAIVEYEPDPDLRDVEKIALLETGGIDAFLEREVLPYAPLAWYDPQTVKVGYEINFSKYFSKPAQQRPLDEIQADLRAIERVPRGHTGIYGTVIRSVDASVRMKASRIEWLGDIPAHWEVTRAKRLFSVRKERARPGDVQLSATQAYGVIPQADFEAKVGRRVVRISKNLEQRRHVEKDDFIISMRSFQGGLERAWASGAIRSSYVVLKPSAEVDPDFFGHLLKSPAYIRALQSTADFIRDGQDLNFANFCQVDLPLVPLEEQRAIALFIAGAHIDEAVARLRQEIGLLTEFRTALISEAIVGKLEVPPGEPQDLADSTSWASVYGLSPEFAGEEETFQADLEEVAESSEPVG
jgi:type I restriction enzyme M protein